MRPTRIIWKRTQYNGWRGHIADRHAGLIEIAHISWGMTRGDDSPWKLRMSLPGFGRESSFPDTDEAMNAAEGRLDNFLTLAQTSEGSTEA